MGLVGERHAPAFGDELIEIRRPAGQVQDLFPDRVVVRGREREARVRRVAAEHRAGADLAVADDQTEAAFGAFAQHAAGRRMIVRLAGLRSEEHTSELQSLMRISYAVFCLKKKT